MLRQTGLDTAREGMRMVGLAVGAPDYQQDWAVEFLRAKLANVVCSLALMEDTQTSLENLRLSPATTPHFLPRTLLLPIVRLAGKSSIPSWSGT